MVASGAEPLRREKPATPSKHLVAYTVVFDDAWLLRVEHQEAGLWLPPGGHVEPGDRPRDSVVRDMLEELGVAPPQPISPPATRTCTETIGATAGHVDVSLCISCLFERIHLTRDVDDTFQDLRWFRRDAIPCDRTNRT